MANLNSNSSQLPDWWQREKQTRQKRVLLFLIVLLSLIVYFYYISVNGRIGVASGINFDSSNYIAFVRETSEKHDGRTNVKLGLYAVRNDGTGLKRLTESTDSSDKASPSWTADGKNVLYVSNLKDVKLRQIYILGDGPPKQLTYGAGAKDYPMASMDKKRIAFVAQGAIKTVNMNGTEVLQEIPRPRSGGTESDSPVQQAADPEGGFLGVGMASDGIGIGGVLALSSESISLMSGAIPVGDQMAEAVPNGASKAFLLDTGHEVSLCWEPKGKRLATSFTELPKKDPQGNLHFLHGINIWTFDNLQKPTAQSLFTGVDFTIEPKNIAWSADGTKMAFEGWRFLSEGHRELAGIAVIAITDQGLVVTADNLDAVKYMIDTTNGKPSHPKWSPDGTQLLYEMTRPDGGSDLWVINSDGTSPINLTKGEGSNTQAAWSPGLGK